MFDHPDIKDFILLLQKHEVNFVLIGGHAVICYSQPRYTQDIDLLVGIDKKSASGCIAALIEFGIPENQINKKLFENEGNFFKLGQEPWRIDIITSVKGLSFQQIYERAVIFNFSGLDIKVIAKEDLITLKKLAGRPQDLMDVSYLEADTNKK